MKNTWKIIVFFNVLVSTIFSTQKQIITNFDIYVISVIPTVYLFTIFIYKVVFTTYRHFYALSNRKDNALYLNSAVRLLSDCIHFPECFTYVYRFFLAFTSAFTWCESTFTQVMAALLKPTYGYKGPEEYIDISF